MKTCSKAPILLEWNRMTPRSQLIFDKLAVCYRTEECKNHSHLLKLKKKSE